MAVIPATHKWATNAELIADVATLYIDPAARVLDPTYGHGSWWALYRPGHLVASDLDPDKSPIGESIDFRTLPAWLGHFDVIAFDPPYKLNGTDQGEGARYGVSEYASWRDRHHLICDGIAHLAGRLNKGGRLLLKCQDQVCGGKVRWQTVTFTQMAWNYNLELVDRFDMIGHSRPQPMEGRTQRRAHGRPSTLLVFQKAS